MKVLMLLENNPYPQDVRVNLEATTLCAAGYTVTVVAPRGPGQPARERIEGVRIRRFRMPPQAPGAAGIVLEYLVANLALHLRGVAGLLAGARVVHLHNPPDTLFMIALLARRLGRRVVYDQHDISPELFEIKFGPSRIVRVLGWLERRTARSADHTLSVNESLRDLLRERNGLSAGRMSVVRNAPPATMLAAQRSPREGTLSDPRLVFLGSMESQDGVDDLPELVRLLRDEHGLAGVGLVVLGDGGRREAVQLACSAAGVAEHVTFLGRVAHDRVAGYLADADICLEPAPVNEMNHRCSMVKVYEYMAAGRPIVSYPLQEVQALGGDGIVYAPAGDLRAFAACVTRLARDSPARLRYAETLRDRAHRFTWEGTSAPALVAAYASLG
jgi:glycosyltransferase involved in cell wall biosynthesis